MTKDLDDESSSPLFSRTDGVTRSERYLQYLCEKSFLSLWSYPRVFRDQGKSEHRNFGKEVCDLLVVFGNHIIVFSDKHYEFPDTGNINVDWIRWYKRTILKSAQQVWGAERWIREFPDRLFLDQECQQPFPLNLPSSAELIIHRIVIANGAKRRCKSHFNGGSGSLIIDSTLDYEDHLSSDSERFAPFAIGQVDLARGFVHIFDEASLDIVMKTLDTITDFIEYLTKRERFLTSINVLATGEEELLAFYLQKLDKDKEHDFVGANKSCVWQTNVEK